MRDYRWLFPEALQKVAILVSDRSLPQSPEQRCGIGGQSFNLWDNA